MRLVDIRRVILAIGFELYIITSAGNSRKWDGQQTSLLCRKKSTPVVGVAGVVS